MKKKITALGILGMGRIGRVHLNNLLHHPQVHIVAVSDPDASCRDFARQLGIEQVFEDHSAVINHPEVEAVGIFTPTDTHFNLILEAADRGKHIFCEKPIDLDLGKIQQAAQRISDTGVKFMLGFNRRFDAEFARVKTLIQEGRIGTPYIVKITSRDPAPPPIDYIRSSGGMFLDMSIHDFDMARYMFEDEVEEVYAQGDVFIDPAIKAAGDIDTAIITLRFKKGGMAVIDNCRKTSFGYDQRIEVFGSDGMVANNNVTADRHTLYNVQGVHRALPLDFFMQRYTQAYRTEVERFVEAILNDEQPPVGVYDGLQATVIALAAQRSLETRQKVKISSVLEENFISI